jgi:hypothetical protein
LRLGQHGHGSDDEPARVRLPTRAGEKAMSPTTRSAMTATRARASEPERRSASTIRCSVCRLCGWSRNASRLTFVMASTSAAPSGRMECWDISPFPVRRLMATACPTEPADSRDPRLLDRACRACKLDVRCGFSRCLPPCGHVPSASPHHTPGRPR